MINPSIRSEGGLRRFIVHAAHESRDRGKVVRAPGFEEAALAFAEAWRPTLDATGAVRLVLTDLDTGERQEAAIEVARPGVADLQVRRARYEARAAGRPETPPGAERFAIGPLTPAEAPMAGTRTRPKTFDMRRLLINAAAVLVVALVAAAVATQLIRDRMSRTPWTEAGGPETPAAPPPGPPALRAAVLQPEPAPAPPATPPPATVAARSRPVPRRPAPAAPAPPDDGLLSLPAPQVAPEPLELPGPAAPEPTAPAPEPATEAAPPAGDPPASQP